MSRSVTVQPSLLSVHDMQSLVQSILYQVKDKLRKGVSSADIASLRLIVYVHGRAVKEFRFLPSDVCGLRDSIIFGECPGLGFEYVGEDVPVTLTSFTVREFANGVLEWVLRRPHLQPSDVSLRLCVAFSDASAADCKDVPYRGKYSLLPRYVVEAYRAHAELGGRGLWA